MNDELTMKLTMKLTYIGGMQWAGLCRPQGDGIGNAQRNARIRFGDLSVGQFRRRMIRIVPASVRLQTTTTMSMSIIVS